MLEFERLLAALETAPADRRDLAAVATAVRLAGLPVILAPDDVARLLRVDVKVVYAAVREHGLPMRRVGKVKCLRGLTLPILLWIAGSWAVAATVESNGQGRVVPNRKGRR